jgi:hypothetical protein
MKADLEDEQIGGICSIFAVKGVAKNIAHHNKCLL